eukprot:762844-Hanusia_phi.AAC.2
MTPRGPRERISRHPTPSGMGLNWIADLFFPLLSASRQYLVNSIIRDFEIMLAISKFTMRISNHAPLSLSTKGSLGVCECVQ